MSYDTNRDDWISQLISTHKQSTFLLYINNNRT